MRMTIKEVIENFYLEREKQRKQEVVVPCEGEEDNPKAYASPHYEDIPPRFYSSKRAFDFFTED